MVIRVYGEPKGQPRPRAFSRGGHASVYDPGTAEGWKGQVAMAFNATTKDIPRPQTQGPIRLDLMFLMPRPGRLLRKSSPQDRIPHVGTPDIDNLAKAVLDALTQLGVWRDDSQVWTGTWSKCYAAVGERPGCIIEIKEDAK